MFRTSPGTERKTAGLTLLSTQNLAQQNCMWSVRVMVLALQGRAPSTLKHVIFSHFTCPLILALSLQNEVHAFHYVCLMQKPNRKGEHLKKKKA